LRLRLLQRLRTSYHRLLSNRSYRRQRNSLRTSRHRCRAGNRLYRQQKNKPVDNYPTEQEVLARINAIIKNIGRPTPYKIAFRYFIKWDDAWSPIPSAREHEPFWSTNYRKPNGGMLLDHMAELGFSAGQTIYIGDRPEDQAAAQAAGCYFAWERDYFP
jgi:hypothetical protein